MKRVLLTVISLLMLHSANALIVSVAGYGEIPETGTDILVTDAEQDPLTGKQVMKLEGNLLTSAAQISVHIYRSASNLIDEFCCGNNCTAGNGLQEETKTFDVNGVVQWYTHYTPQAGSDESIRYVFDDGIETRELRVRYTYATDDVEQVHSLAPSATKELKDGQLFILRDGQTYSVTGIH